jgi:hypothetical protein
MQIAFHKFIVHAVPTRGGRIVEID